MTVEECTVLGDLHNLDSRILKEGVYIIDNAIGSFPVISDIQGLERKANLLNNGVEGKGVGVRGRSDLNNLDFHITSVQGLETVLVGRLP